MMPSSALEALAAELAEFKDPTTVVTAGRLQEMVAKAAESLADREHDEYMGDDQ